MNTLPLKNTEMQFLLLRWSSSKPQWAALTPQMIINYQDNPRKQCIWNLRAKHGGKMEHRGRKTAETFVVHSPPIGFNSQADTNGPNPRIVSQLRNAHPTFESNELIDSKAIRV